MSAIQTAEILRDLSAAVGEDGPHPAQKVVLHDVFGKKHAIVQVDCGRKWGKTELCLYTLYRWALFSKGEYYYIAPFLKQAKELVWANMRAQNFMPEYVTGVNNSELRIHLKNGSSIKLDGSDNHQAYRGINPHGLVYDEFKDHRPEFHEAMSPNLATHEAQLLIVGTPPDETEMPSEEGGDEVSQRHAYDLMIEDCKIRDDCSYHTYQTWANPHIGKDWLRKTKASLIRRGEEAVWYREYEAKRVPGGKNTIFPMIDKQHVMRHGDLMEEIDKDRNKLQWMVVADPGSSTVFAMLFAAFHPYKKTLYLLDEIYERDQSSTSTGQMIPRKRLITDSLWRYHPKDAWMQIYDEAGTWFAVEALNTFGESWMPTTKAHIKKDEGLSLIKDQLLNNLVVISTRCRFLLWEMVNYKKDPKTGRIPKKNDHLIDCWRYMNAGYGLGLQEEREPKESRRRFMTPDQEFRIWQERLGIVDEFEVDASLADFDWQDS